MRFNSFAFFMARVSTRFGSGELCVTESGIEPTFFLTFPPQVICSTTALMRVLHRLQHAAAPISLSALGPCCVGGSRLLARCCHVIRVAPHVETGVPVPVMKHHVIFTHSNSSVGTRAAKFATQQASKYKAKLCLEPRWLCATTACTKPAAPLASGRFCGRFPLGFLGRPVDAQCCRSRLARRIDKCI